MTVVEIDLESKIVYKNHEDLVFVYAGRGEWSVIEETRMIFFS